MMQPSCSGNCQNCGSNQGCSFHGDLTITEGEMLFLKRLAVIPFLPVARKLGEDVPYFFDPEDPTADYGNLLLCLEKKQLISLDYDKPIAGFSDSHYDAYQLLGSMALTLRGQQVLELAEIQGVIQGE